jgi:dTDP-4-dehydrorhamnose 3,5-epimerase-like enzyme
MTLKDRIRFIERSRLSDERGWFLKVLTGLEDELPEPVGEMYFTHAVPGQVRGNHFHHLAHEWFTVIQGVAEVGFLDPKTGERLDYVAKSSTPVTIHVPPGIVHAFKNPETATEPMLLVAYSSEIYDSADTVVHSLL